MNRDDALIAAAMIIITLLLPSTGDAQALVQRSKNQVRQFSLPRHAGTTTLKGAHGAKANHIFRFRARGGEQMTINLTLLRTGIGREGDLVFWIQCRGWYPAGRSTSVLEGIDNGGATNWSGLLPETGEYEIYVSNPPIRDHPIGRSLPYKLTITTKRMRRGSFSKFNPQTPHIQLAESKQKLNSKQITLKLNPELEP